MYRNYPKYYSLDPSSHREYQDLHYDPSHQTAYRNMDATKTTPTQQLQIKEEAKKTFYQSTSDDRVYYNIIMPYNPDKSGFSPAIYQEQLNQPIILNPSDYYMAIQRFSIPTANIPIFIPEIQPYPNTDTNLTIYSVSLGWKGNFYQQFVEFVSTSPNAMQSAALTATHIYADKTPYYYVYSYQVFLTMINTALAAAFVGLNAIATLPADSVAPFFIYDPSLQRISLIAQGAFYLSNNSMEVANPIGVYVNDSLFEYLDGIPNMFLGIDQPNGLDYQFIIADYYNNYALVNYPPFNIPIPADIEDYDPIIMEQEYSTLTNWSSFQTLQLVSNLIPIKQEFSPSATANGLDTTGQLNSVPLIKDFVPLLDPSEPAARTVVNFTNDGPYQLINLTSTQALSKFDITIYWTDQFQNRYILDIPYNQNVSIKLVFIKKSSYNASDNKTI